MIRTPPLRALVLAALFLATAPLRAEGPNWKYPFKTGSNAFDVGKYAPGQYGYQLDDTSAGYYGGIRYREYYSYARGMNWAYYPGPFIGCKLPPDYRGPVSHHGQAWVDDGPVSELSAAGNSSVQLVIQVPADAEVWLNGAKTTQTGANRLFVSPPLNPGETYEYEIRARWEKDGNVTVKNKNVPVQPGYRVTVNFTPAAKAEKKEALPAPKELKLPDAN